jgi:site-specific recombinase XerD
MMNEFDAFLGAKAKRNIAAITSRDIAAFRDSRAAQGLAPSTLNTDMTVISAAFNAAQRQGHIGVNPCGAIEALKNRTAHKATFTPEQVSALVDIAEGEWKGLILTAFIPARVLVIARTSNGNTAISSPKLKRSGSIRLRPAQW